MLDIQDALSLLEKGDARDAARLLEQMVAEMPAYATAHLLLARSYEALNEWDRASTMWLEAFQLMPDSPVIRQGLQRAASRSAGRRSHAQAEEEPDSAETTLRAQDVSPPTHLPPEQHLPPEHHLPPPRETPRPRESALPPEAPDDLSELQGVEDTGTPHYEDLDRLISELESARIVPRPDLDDVPSPDLQDDIEDVVSETLARIYASQGQYDEAARVYELLAGQHPEEADEYLQMASTMRSRASDGE